MKYNLYVVGIVLFSILIAICWVFIDNIALNITLTIDLILCIFAMLLLIRNAYLDNKRYEEFWEKWNTFKDWENKEDE